METTTMNKTTLFRTLPPAAKISHLDLTLLDPSDRPTLIILDAHDFERAASHEESDSGYWDPAKGFGVVFYNTHVAIDDVQNPKPFCCTDCRARFSTSTALRLHVNAKH